MLTTTRKEVSEYRSIVRQIHDLIEDHPEVNRSYICDTVLEKFNRTSEWFLVMQGYHKQSIKDSIQGKHE